MMLLLVAAFFRFYRLEDSAWMEQELANIAAQSPVFADLEAQHVVPLPARFTGAAELLGYELLTDQLTPGQQVHLVLYRRAYGPVYEPLSRFAHLLDLQSNVVGQYDGFDVPACYWGPGAVVVQVYRFPISQDAQPGVHWQKSACTILRRWSERVSLAMMTSSSATGCCCPE